MNGDKYIGMFKNGKPNGQGQMFYKNSVPASDSTSEFDIAVYKGNFRQGKREGRGKMIWGDGSVYDGQWHDDSRQFGKMIMANG